MHPNSQIDPDLLLGALHKAFKRHDMLALLQAARFVRLEGISMPAWCLDTYEEVLSGILNGAKGTPGKGNRVFGNFRKDYIRTVRASAYLYVMAWKANPHSYPDMPQRVIQKWFDGKIQWSPEGYMEASRYAQEALKGRKPYLCNARTIRNAATGMDLPIRWGRWEVEESLGLRGEGCIFGPPPGRPPKHILEFLQEYTDKG